MSVTAKDYYEAAKERGAQAKWLFQLADSACEELAGKRYSLSVYLAGLSVECLFRAFRVKVSTQFDSRHDLEKLFALSRISNRLEQSLLQRGECPEVISRRRYDLEEAVDVTVQIWTNSIRFHCDRSLVSYLIKNGTVLRDECRGSKAQVLRKLTCRLLEHTAVIQRAGEESWT